MNRRPTLLVLSSLIVLLWATAPLRAQDTVVVQTLTYDSTSRAGVWHFPDAGQFEKVIMQYSMRCHHGIVSTQTQRSQGCGEWDYNCETYIWDSTRVDSLKAMAPSSTITGWSNGNFPFTRTPTSTLIRRDLKNVSYVPVPTWIKGQIGGSAGGGLDDPNHDSPLLMRRLAIFTANQLLTSGIKAGQIQGMAMPLSAASSMAGLTIRMRSTKDSIMSEARSLDTGFTTVYFSNLTVAPSTSTLYFYQPFVWDGKSNILVEYSFTNPTEQHDAGLGGVTEAYPVSMSSDAISPQYTLNFSGQELIQLPTTGFESVVNEITVAVWAYGDPTQLPGANTVLCEGVDAKGNRQVNVHLPWSDNNIYWDCGGDGGGGFDRIQKAAPAINVAGHWNHWAFTKNSVTGSMKIYLNGVLWMKDTGKRHPIDLKQMNLGSGITGSVSYAGELSRFSIWDKELDSNQIKSIMMSDGPPADSLRVNLIANYKLDEGQSTRLMDSAHYPSYAQLQGVPVWRSLRGNDLFANFRLSNALPSTTFLQSLTPVTPTIIDTYVTDTLIDPPHRVVDFVKIGDDKIQATDTTYLYQATKTYTYNDQGVRIDSLNVHAADTVRIMQIPYWAKSPQKFELMSFVTPYGVGLDLGKTGKMYEFDVTDYLPVMKGWKRLSMERGAGQEDFDLRFLFIHGTPTRPVLDMQQIWPMTEEAYQTIQSDYRYEPREVYLNPAAKGFKLRSYITGHGQDPNNTGQNGEFQPQTHYLSVNKKKYERLVLKECSSNPMYPLPALAGSGGTWNIPRAGWCPGMATDLAEYEITGTVNPGDSALIDYGVEGGVGDSRYDPSTQIVTYGAPSFTHDAAIVHIVRPSDHIEDARINPACDLPVVVIRNNGSAALTSLQIEYYVDNGPHRTYNWTGNLKFLDTTTVVLPVDSLSFWTTAPNGQFHVDISKPNGGTDEYAQNDHYSSNFTQPPMYSGIVVVNTLTNKNSEQNRYEITNMKGDTVFANDGSNFNPSTNYYDSLILPTGCYTMLFHDDGEDGLAIWYNTAQGNGSLKIRQTSKSGKILKTFNPDFGKYLQYDFSIGQAPLGVGTADVPFRRVSLYPNPAESFVHIELDGYPSEMILMEIVDERGNVLRREQHATGSPGNLNCMMKLDGLAKGSYFMRLTTQDGMTERGFVVE